VLAHNFSVRCAQHNSNVFSVAVRRPSERKRRKSENYGSVQSALKNNFKNYLTNNR
jgi:hypothetical protein